MGILGMVYLSTNWLYVAEEDRVWNLDFLAFGFFDTINLEGSEDNEFLSLRM